MLPKASHAALARPGCFGLVLLSKHFEPSMLRNVSPLSNLLLHCLFQIFQLPRQNHGAFPVRRAVFSNILFDLPSAII